MREIKFRGKTQEGEWVYGSLCTNPYDDDDVEIVDHSEVFLPRESVLPDTIGQYTGLKDANGTEIYEGDLVKSAFSERVVGMVAWNTNGYFYILESFFINEDYEEQDRRPLGEMLRLSIENTPCNFTVIGNIHDNPELMTYV